MEVLKEQEKPKEQESYLGLDDIRAAAERLDGNIQKTPFVHAGKLSQTTGADIWLKLECLQYTGAFKERGALNKLLKLCDEEKSKGVVAASAGNHAQGLAYHAKRLGVPAKIVMPITTPDVKVQKTKDLGAQVILHGLTFDEASTKAKELQAAEGLTAVHPFDDLDIIAGQGTVALEMLAQYAELDCVIVPIGGGGLIGGMATALKALKPSIEVIGVQSDQFPSMLNAVNGQNLPMGESSLAEGIAVKNAGALTQKIVKDTVDDLVVVNEGTLEKALSLIMSEQKVLVEGAGAAGFAAVLSDLKRFKGKKVGLVLCGGNIDQRLLSMILMRDLARSGRLARLRIQLLDIPGQLVRVSTIIAEQDGNIIDVGHHRTYSDLPAKMTCMDVTVDTQGQVHLERIIKALEDQGYPVDIAAY